MPNLMTLMGGGKMKLVDSQDIKGTQGGNATSSLSYSVSQDGFLVTAAGGESSYYYGIKMYHNGTFVDHDWIDIGLHPDAMTWHANLYSFYVKKGDTITVSYTNPSGYSNRHLLLKIRLYK